MRTRTLKLVRGAGGKYTVIIVKNSTVYGPGQVLCKLEVDDLCRRGEWEVIVVGQQREDDYHEQGRGLPGQAPKRLE